MKTPSVILKQRGLGAALLCCLLSVVATDRQTSAQTQRVPSPAGYSVLVNGQGFGMFARASGLPQNEVVLGGNRAEPDRTVGRVERKYVTLSGCDRNCSLNFLRWSQTAQPRPVTIVVQAAGGRQVGRYELTNAIPVSVKAGQGVDVTVQLAYSSIRRAQ